MVMHISRTFFISFNIPFEPTDTFNVFAARANFFVNRTNPNHILLRINGALDIFKSIYFHAVIKSHVFLKYDFLLPGPTISRYEPESSLPALPGTESALCMHAV